MKRLLLIVLISFSFSSFAYVDPSKYVLVFYGKKPKTTESVEEFSKVKDVRMYSGRKKVDLNVPEDGDWSAFYHPFMSFYGNKDLQGSAVLEINQAGIFVKGRQVCKVYLSQPHSGNPKYYTIHYYVEIEDGDGIKDCPHLESRDYMKIVHPSEDKGYALYAEDFDGDVAEVKMEIEGEEKTLYTRIDKNHLQNFKYYSPSKEILEAAFKRTPKLKELHGKVLNCLKEKSVECLSKLPHVEPSDKDSLQEIFDIYEEYHFPERNVFEVLHRGLSMKAVRLQGYSTFLRVIVKVGGREKSTYVDNLSELNEESGEILRLNFSAPDLSEVYEDVEIWPVTLKHLIRFYQHKVRVDGKVEEKYKIEIPKPYKTMDDYPL